MVPAGVPSQTVLYHLADLWLRLGHQLRTTMQEIERTSDSAIQWAWSRRCRPIHQAIAVVRASASPAKQCLTALTQSVGGLLSPGSTPYEQVTALAYAYLYFRAKWVRGAGRDSLFETVSVFTTSNPLSARQTTLTLRSQDLSQLTDLQLGQLTRHEFQGEVSEVLQLQTPWEQVSSLLERLDSMNLVDSHC